MSRPVPPARPGPFLVVRKSYSVKPWRIVDGEGYEIQFEREDVVVHGVEQSLHVMGYDTKRAAVQALGRLAFVLYERLRATREELRKSSGTG